MKTDEDDDVFKVPSKPWKKKPKQPKDDTQELSQGDMAKVNEGKKLYHIDFSYLTNRELACVTKYAEYVSGKGESLPK